MMILEGAALGDQARVLDAIEGLQCAFNTIRGAPDRPVVLAKFRQFQPFEMGIENGE